MVGTKGEMPVLRFIQNEMIKCLHPQEYAGGYNPAAAQRSFHGSRNGAGGLLRWAQGLAQSVYALLRICAFSISPSTHFNSNHPFSFFGAVPQANFKLTRIL